MDTILAAEHMWNTAQIPMYLRGLGLQDCKEINDKTLVIAKEYAESFEQRYLPTNCPVERFPRDRARIGVGMTISGPAGRGKTTVACAIATEIALKYRETIFFIAAPDYLHAVFARHGQLVPDAERHALATVYHRTQHAALLILDDMGSEMIANSGSAQKEFSRLIRDRFSNARPTIITSNLGPTGWAESYGAATGSFLQQAAPIIAMMGPNLRAGA